jgi:hypothetical protein
VSLKASNGFYVSTTGESDTLTANEVTVGLTEMFEFLRLSNGDVGLRAFGGGGHLINRNSNVNFFYPNGDSGSGLSTDQKNILTIDTRLRR